MDRLLAMAVLPNGKLETVMYTVDIIGTIMTVAWIVNMKEGLSIYILGLTAISLTITVAVKLYNLITNNAKNKKL